MDINLQDLATTECGCMFYMSGGWHCDESGKVQASKEIVEFDPKNNKSRLAANMTRARAGHLIACSKGIGAALNKLLICGGFEPNGWCIG